MKGMLPIVAVSLLSRAVAVYQLGRLKKLVSKLSGGVLRYLVWRTLVILFGTASFKAAVTIYSRVTAFIQVAVTFAASRINLFDFYINL